MTTAGALPVVPTAGPRRYQGGPVTEEGGALGAQGAPPVELCIESASIAPHAFGDTSFPNVLRPYHSFAKRICLCENVLRRASQRTTFWSKALSLAKVFLKTLPLGTCCARHLPRRGPVTASPAEQRVAISCVWHAKHFAGAKHASRKCNTFETLRYDITNKPKAIGETPSAFAHVGVSRGAYAKGLRRGQSARSCAPRLPFVKTLRAALPLQLQAGPRRPAMPPASHKATTRSALGCNKDGSTQAKRCPPPPPPKCCCSVSYDRCSQHSRLPSVCASPASTHRA